MADWQTFPIEIQIGRLADFPYRNTNWQTGRLADFPYRNTNWQTFLIEPPNHKYIIGYIWLGRKKAKILYISPIIDLERLGLYQGRGLKGDFKI